MNPREEIERILFRSGADNYDVAVEMLTNFITDLTAPAPGTAERVAEALVTESFGAEFLSEQTPEWQDYFRRLARAAIAALKPAPGTDSSGQAVQRGTDLIATERARQVEQEGWTPEHDAEHDDEDLALAACCYALPVLLREYRNVAVPIEGGFGVETVPTLWPWAPGYWKPKPDDRVRELVKAGALIAAEIDRLRAVAGPPARPRRGGAVTGPRRYPDLRVELMDLVGDALKVIEAEDGLNATEIVNRAVLVFAALRGAADDKGEVSVTVPEGDRRIIAKVRQQ